MKAVLSTTALLAAHILANGERDTADVKKSRSLLSKDRAEQCSFQSIGVSGDTLKKEDALFRSDSGNVFVVKGNNDPHMRYLAFESEEKGCHEQCTVRCQHATGSDCQPDPTPIDSVFNSMLGAMTFSGSSPQHIVTIGLGCGALTHWPLANFPNATQHVVDIDGDVIRAATGFFGVPSSLVVQRDGCQYLREQADSSIDILFLDAFDASNSWPSCFLDKSFLRDVSKKLAPGGFIIGDVWDAFAERVKRSARSAALSMKVGIAPGLGNKIIVFSNAPLTEPTDRPFGGGDVARWFQEASFADID